MIEEREFEGELVGVECPKLELNLNVPNHSNELSRTDYVIQKLRNRFNKLIVTNGITDELHTEIYDEVCSSLDFIGRLSKKIFELQNEIETKYTMAYIHCADQVKVKRTWYKAYEDLHQPYSILKNRCFTLLEDLDDEFIRKFNKKPSNYSSKLWKLLKSN